MLGPSINSEQEEVVKNQIAVSLGLYTVFSLLLTNILYITIPEYGFFIPIINFIVLFIVFLTDKNVELRGSRENFAEDDYFELIDGRPFIGSTREIIKILRTDKILLSIYTSLIICNVFLSFSLYSDGMKWYGLLLSLIGILLTPYILVNIFNRKSDIHISKDRVGAYYAGIEKGSMMGDIESVEKGIQSIIIKKKDGSEERLWVKDPEIVKNSIITRRL
jgi:hypothetical protein